MASGTKIFRDPIYNYIDIDLKKDRWLLDLLDTPEVQRLRRIHQLGVSYLTYPGADHNRLSHCLGVLHLMKHALGHLATEHQDAQVESARHPLLAAALLHDVGHGPFSHLFEPCLDIDHEEWSCKIILDPDAEVNKVLRDIDGSLPGRVAALVDKDNHSQPFWQKNLISSQLDVDRLDYLRRDSLFTGAGYGHFNWTLILNSFGLNGDPGRRRDLCWSEKSKYAIEEYVFSRFYMYENVYLHKTTRGYEKILQAMWSRAKGLKEVGSDVGLVPPIAAFWGEEDPSAMQYLAIEEHTVMTQIQVWASHRDRALSDLAGRFLARRGFAVIEAPITHTRFGEGFEEWEAALRVLVASNGYGEAPEAYVLRDDLKLKIYEAYYPEKESDDQDPANAIRILIDDSPKEISSVLERLKAVTNKPAHARRYYVPKELRKKADELRRGWKTSM